MRTSEAVYVDFDDLMSHFPFMLRKFNTADHDFAFGGSQTITLVTGEQFLENMELDDWDFDDDGGLFSPGVREEVEKEYAALKEKCDELDDKIIFINVENRKK